MTQEQIIRNCENLLEGNSQDPLYQMHGNQFSKKGCLKFQIYVNIKTWVGKN